MRVLLSSLVCFLVVVITAGSVVNHSRASRVLSHGAQPHGAAVPAPKAKKAPHHTTPGDEDSLAKALFDDLSSSTASQKKAHHTAAKNVAKKVVHRDLEKENTAAAAVAPSLEENGLGKVLAAETDLEAITDKLMSLKSELKGIETAIRGEDHVQQSKPAPASSEESAPVANIQSAKAIATAVDAASNEDNSNKDNEVSNKLASNDDDSSTAAVVPESASVEDVAPESASNSNDDDNVVASSSESATTENEPVAAASDETPASAATTASSEEVPADSDVSLLQLSGNNQADDESLVEQLTRTRMNINKRMAAIKLAEAEIAKKALVPDRESITIIGKANGKSIPVDGTGKYKQIAQGVVTVDNSSKPEDKDVVCVCKRSSAPRGADRVRCKKHVAPSPSPLPPPPKPPVGIRQCATGRWPNGSKVDAAGSQDTICIYFPAKLDIPAPTPIPAPPTEPEYPPECYDERNEFVAPGIDKRAFDVLLLQQGFETCGC